MHTKNRYTQIDIYRYTVHEQNIYTYNFTSIHLCIHTYITLHYPTLHYATLHASIHPSIHHTYIPTYLHTYIHT